MNVCWEGRSYHMIRRWNENLRENISACCRMMCRWLEAAPLLVLQGTGAVNRCDCGEYAIIFEALTKKNIKLVEVPSESRSAHVYTRASFGGN